MESDQAAHAPTPIELLKESARREYPLRWRNLIADWKTGAADALWLTYSANYLFRTAGLRWAMDPLSPSTRLPGMPAPDYATDLAGCSLIVLTHAHDDHLSVQLIAALSMLPVQWVIPEHTLPAVLAQCHIPSSQIIIPQNGRPLVFGGVSLTPFDGLHRRGTHGIAATGYLVEFQNRRWLFPGDTRQYDLRQLPSFGPLDGCFAHLWLGRNGAALEKPPLIEEFCAFFAGLRPKQLVVTHLNELGRDESDLWQRRHYEMVAQRLAGSFANGKIHPAFMGDRVELNGE